MILLATWNTLEEVAAYLLDRTGEPWTPRLVLERFAGLTPETVTICPPIGVHILILKDGRWEDWTYSQPMLFDVGGVYVDGCLRQWLIANSASNIRMVRGNERFQTTAQIAIECVRIHRNDVDKLPMEFHFLVEKLVHGQHFELRATLDLLDTNRQSSDIPLRNAEPRVESVASTNNGGKRKQADAMAVLLEELVPVMMRQGKDITASTVMGALKKLDVPCIV